MALFSSSRSALLFVLALRCGCNSLVADVPADVSSLIQWPAANTNIRKSSPKLSLAAKATSRWPNLEDLWDDVKDSVANITEKVGEITQEAASKVDELGQAVHDLEESAVGKVVAALSSALGFVQDEADLLLNETIKEKARLNELYDKLNNSMALANGTILPEFEFVVHGAIAASWAQWQSLREIVDRSANVVTKGIDAAGQEKLAMTLGDSINSAEHKLDGFMQKLKSADDAINGIGEMKMRQAEAALRDVDKLLNQALQDITGFIDSYSQAFQDAIDSISDSLSHGLGNISRQFSSIHHNITSISWRVRSSARELVLGLHRVIVRTAKAENMSVPEWHSASTLELQSAAPARGSLALALIAATCTALCAAGWSL